MSKRVVSSVLHALTGTGVRKPGRPRRGGASHKRKPVRWTVDTLTEDAVKAEMHANGMNMAALTHVMAVMKRHVDAIDQYPGIVIAGDTNPDDDELMQNSEALREAYDDWLDWQKTGLSVLTMKVPAYASFTKFLQYITPTHEVN